VISYILERKKDSEEKHRQTNAVLRLLHRELEHHRGRYQGLLTWVQESIDKGGPAHTGYSYERIRTDAYEAVNAFPRPFTLGPEYSPSGAQGGALRQPICTGGWERCFRIIWGIVRICGMRVGRGKSE
jgi:hypothetical protein